jgi:hypothetical protein
MSRTQPPPGFTLPRVLSSTLVDRDAPDLELEVINKLLPLLADKSHTVFDLCDVSGLNFDELATLLESERVDKAYRAMCRILAIRQKFIDAQSHFVTTAQLLSIASAQPMDAKEADQSRKAANKLHALLGSSPADGGGGRRSLTEGEVLASPSPIADRGGEGGGRRSLTEGEVFASPTPAPHSRTPTHEPHPPQPLDGAPASSPIAQSHPNEPPRTAKAAAHPSPRTLRPIP